MKVNIYATEHQDTKSLKKNNTEKLSIDQKQNNSKEKENIKNFSGNKILNTNQKFKKYTQGGAPIYILFLY